MKVCDDELRDAIEFLIEVAQDIDTVNSEFLVDELHKAADTVQALL